MPEQPPPFPSVSEEPAERGARPVRRSKAAVAALILGVLAIPLALTVYLGLLCGVLGVIFGLIGLVHTRQGRALGRGMAIAGLVAGLLGSSLAISLGIYGLRAYKDCQAKVGHAPSRDELRDCARSGI